tara:strand:+ start:509 stop:1705 length:1197 start_codon:yes stop_codon:yes gene_type:complete
MNQTEQSSAAETVDDQVKILFLVTEDWYFFSHRLALAQSCRNLGWNVVVATHINKNYDEMKRQSFEIVPIRMRRGYGNLFSEIFAIFELIKIYRHHKPDIIHNVALKPVIYGSLAARFTRTAPVINMLAGMGYVFSRGGLSTRLIRAAIKLALKSSLSPRRHWLIVQNNTDATVLIGNGIASAERTKIISGSGVNVQKFKPTPEPEGPVIVAVVSRMLKDKGIREAVMAARELKRRRVDIEIWLVGDEDPKNPSSLSEETLRQWDEEGCIRWLGYQTDISAIWAKAHIALLPSYREGMPMSLLEAAACGRPIVTTDVPGCNELIKDSVNGILVPKHDWIGIANAIQTLANSPQLRAKLGAAARDTVCGAYSVETVNRETHALYQLALRESKRDRSHAI